MTDIASTTRYVYSFEEPAEGGRELLGGKGIGLAEMTQLGIPVPAGFTITTDACRAYMAAHDVPAGLDEEVDAHLGRLEERSGLRFGDPERPLLVSVRSGAAISMPGMMDTILNLGLNDAAVEGLARSTGNARFALDSYRRLIQMYGEVVDGIDAHRFESALAELKAAKGVAQDTDLDEDDLRGLVATFEAIYEEELGGAFPQDPREQLRRAVRAVFDSWETPRAQVYRRAHDIPDDLGTAVNVVQMVFGNKGDRSATGVCFTRDPSTGEQGMYGEFLVNAQGEDVVAGIRTPEPLERMEEILPDAYAQLDRDDGPARAALPRHAGHRVHGRGRRALPPPDALGEADGRGGAEGRRVDERGGPDHAGGGGRAHRPRAARPAPPSAARPERALRRRREGAQRVAGSRVREGRARRGLGRRAGPARGGDPRPLGDDPGRHPRADRGRGRAHRARRDDLARGRRRTRDGQAVRRRLRGAARRPRRAARAHRRARGARGGDDHDRRRHGRRHPRRRRARRAGHQRGLPDGARLGRRAAPPARARERRHARGRPQGPRVRRAGDRPLPHRAHVHGAGPAARRPRDDHGRERGRPPRGARPAAADAAVRLRGDLRGDGGPAGDDPAARPAAARVPAAARGGAGRADAAADQGAAGGEPDARHARLPPRAPVAGGLRDAGAGDRPGREGRRGARRRGAARRDHAPARRLRRGAAPPARAHRARRRRGGRRRVPVRDDDRAAARVRSRRRDRRARRLLLLRDERPHPDRARLLARRRRGQVPDALPRDGRARAEPVRDARPERRRRPDADRARARAGGEGA